ncbi:RusA family crossover junction endodeoxyribonuclease [Lactobacillus sp. PV037]|uniref:RusA family crossover junction endodeoxyribonuclease n=1 Tax=Lactobacillus sp. PV037 TaxID=2594496 RepID=UPI00223F50CB|nr:RusA family crossover junction endodeoxyribonuclease [Lactobacillus sp. PV037]QNQ83783.1 RusA family crossover junction endodeoxyribonuclease [Lactobacillus sp. PV037]
MKFSFTIPEPPRGKARPRHNKRTGATYTTPEDHWYEARIRQIGRDAYEEYLNANNLEIKMLDEPVGVDIVAYYQIPKSYSKRKTESCLQGQTLPTKKPDIDNIDKAALDGLNPDKRRNPYKRIYEIFSEGIYKDDALVVKNNLLKVYSTTPRLEITITWGSELQDYIINLLKQREENN